MSSVTDIERAVEQLSAKDLHKFRTWFAERDAADWERQLEQDVAAGRLEVLGNEAIRDLQEGRCTDL